MGIHLWTTGNPETGWCAGNQEGDSQASRALIEEALLIDRALVVSDPHRADHKINLAVTLDHLGQLSEQEGDFRSAFAFFEESLHLRRALFAEDPNDPDLPTEIADIERAFARVASQL
jgi:hypothetical protein